jgi:hypothetical protein
MTCHRLRNKKYLDAQANTMTALMKKDETQHIA